MADAGQGEGAGFELAVVQETFVASRVFLRPAIDEAEIPVSTANGLADVHISDIRDDPEDPHHFLLRAKVALTGQRRRNILDDDAVRVSKDQNVITVGQELSFDPDSEKSILKSKSLWLAMGIGIVTLAGIKVTRSVRRARHS